MVDASGRSALSEAVVLRVQPAVVDVTLPRAVGGVPGEAGGGGEFEIGEVGRPAVCPVAPVVW